jgi:hypothetical protein
LRCEEKIGTIRIFESTGVSYEVQRLLPVIKLGRMRWRVHAPCVGDIASAYKF